MDEDVTLELTGEEQRQRARIAAANCSGAHRAAEILREKAEAAARRRLLVCRVEWNDHCRLPRRHVHLNRDRGTDDGGDEGHELFGETAQDDPRIDRHVGRGKLVEKLRDRDTAGAHRRGEELLLGWEVPEDRRRGNADDAGDVRERGRGEAALGERGTGGLEDLLAVDAGGSAHFVSKRIFTNCVCQWAFTKTSQQPSKTVRLTHSNRSIS